MPTFVLIDHSLRQVGSHHFEYAHQVLRAARERGYEIVLATHRDFEKADSHAALPAGPSLPGDWKVLPRFPHHTYSKFSPVRPGGQARKPVHGWWSTRAPESFSEALGQRWNRIGQRRRVRAFMAACEAVFREVPLVAGDQVFLPTLSDLDLVGVVGFLANNAWTREVDWHLQFHFKFLDGRPPEYAAQEEKVVRLRRHFGDTLKAVTGHRLHFYSTTEEIVDQFDRLGVARFRLLPYPVDPAQRRPGEGDPARRPLRVACAGDVRPEKGQRELAPIVHALWDTHFHSGEVQLLVQSQEEAFAIPPLEERSASLPHGRWPLPSDAPIVVVPHPLGAADYVEMIRCADVGLFLYDSRAYYGRCAGVLVEMLMAGVPVIVPAGSWLGDQIAEPIQRHLEALRASSPALAETAGPPIPWTRPGSNAAASQKRAAVLCVGGVEEPAVAELDVPSGAADLWLGLHFAKDTAPGRYLRTEIVQRDGAGREVARSAAVLGLRRSSGPVATLARLRAEVVQVEMRLRNAYDAEPLQIEDVEVCFLAAASERDPHRPAGAVGLAAADTEQIPELLRDLVAHYRHYRASAEVFAGPWRRDHDPRNAVSILLEEADTSARLGRSG